MKAGSDRPVGSLKEYVLDLVEKFGNGEWRPAGRALGVPYQKLQYLAKEGKKIQELLDFLEDTRRKQKLSKSAMWDSITTANKKK